MTTTFTQERELQIREAALVDMRLHRRVPSQSFVEQTLEHAKRYGAPDIRLEGIKIKAQRAYSAAA